MQYCRLGLPRWSVLAALCAVCTCRCDHSGTCRVCAFSYCRICNPPSHIQYCTVSYSSGTLLYQLNNQVCVVRKSTRPFPPSVSSQSINATKSPPWRPPAPWPPSATTVHLAIKSAPVLLPDGPTTSQPWPLRTRNRASPRGQGGRAQLPRPIFAAFNDTSCTTHLRTRDHLPCHRRNEGQGRPRRGVPVRRHACRPGRRRALQGAQHHRSAHQARATGGNKTKTPGPGARGAPRARLRRHGNWPHRGCHPDPHRLDPQKGWSPWSPSVKTTPSVFGCDFQGSVCTHGDRGKRAGLKTLCSSFIFQCRESLGGGATMLWEHLR